MKLQKKCLLVLGLTNIGMTLLFFHNFMREFISNFFIDNAVCSSVVNDIKIDFNCLMLGELFGVPTVGFDTYYACSKILFSRINEKTVLKF